jgi:hypothetical protein
MMGEIVTSTPRELLLSAMLFSALFGVWAGRSANRKIDDVVRAQAILSEVEDSRSVEDLQRIVDKRTPA